MILATQNKLKKTNKEQQLFLDTIIDAIQDIKGKSIVKIDLRHLDAPTDYFIICQGDSLTQVRAIGDNIKKVVKDKINLLPMNFEAPMDSTWILVDYFDVVVHVFYPETREFYDIETLWGDGIFEAYEDYD